MLGGLGTDASDQVSQRLAVEGSMDAAVFAIELHRDIRFLTELSFCRRLKR